MSNESKPILNPLPVMETTKTMEQLRAEANEIIEQERALLERHEKEVSEIKERKDRIFAQIRYLNQQLRKSSE